MPLYITEYGSLARDASSFHLAVGREPAMAEQEVGVGATSEQSAAFVGNFIMVHAEEAVHLAFGADPTAVATAHRMAAGETRYYGVKPGHKLATITGA